MCEKYSRTDDFPTEMFTTYECETSTSEICTYCLEANQH